MSISFFCMHCGQKNEAPAEASNSSVHCSKCDQEITVPVSVETPTSQAEPQAEIPPAAKPEKLPFTWWPRSQGGRATFGVVLVSLFLYSCGSDSLSGALFLVGLTFLGGSGMRYWLFMKRKPSVASEKNETPPPPIWRHPTAISLLVCSFMFFLYFENLSSMYSNGLQKTDKEIQEVSNGGPSIIGSILKTAVGWFTGGGPGAVVTGGVEITKQLEEHQRVSGEKNALEGKKVAILNAKERSDSALTYSILLFAGLGGFTGIKYWRHVKANRQQLHTKSPV